MSTEPMRASIRIHEPGDPEGGEFVSLHVNAKAAARELTSLQNHSGGHRVSDYVLIRDDGRTYRVWCV